MHRKLSLSVLGVLVGAAIFGVALRGATSEAAGPNLVTNGDFSNGMTGWVPDDPQYTQAVVDQGAAVITSSYPGDGSSFYGMDQCIPIQGGLDYRLEADVFLGVGEPAYGAAQVFVTYASGPQCNTGYLGGNYVSYDNANRDSWQHLVLDSTAPAAAQGVLIELVPTKQQAPSPADPVTARFDNVSFSALDQSTPTPTPQPSATLQICKYVLDNGDAHDDGGTFTFSVAVQGQPPFVSAFPVTASEGGGACGMVMLGDYGISAGGLLTVTENTPAGWTNQAGHPNFSANGGQWWVGTSAGVANLGAAAVEFRNMRVAGEGANDPPPAEPRSLTVCSQIDDNGDADTESGSWDYEVYVQGQQVPFAVVPLTVVEGAQGWDCEAVDLLLEGVANETAFTVTQSVEPLWDDAPFYPAWSAGGAPGSGNSASFTYALGSGPNFNVTFQNKEAVSAPPVDPSPDPTETPTPPPPTPTGTPTPPAPTSTPTPPAPTSTPTPPAPTGTATPPPPTSTPTPPAPTGTPTPPPPTGTQDDPIETPDDPTGTPGDPTGTPDDTTGTPDDPTGTPAAGDDEGTPPAGSEAGEPTSQPEGTGPSAVEGSVQGSTPAPPTAGTGMASPPSGGQAIGAVAALLMAVGGLGIAGLASRKRRQ